MKINVTSVIKGVVGVAVNAGVGTIVGNLVKATTPYELTKTQTVLVGIGSYAVTSVLGELSANYVNTQIDEVSSKIQKVLYKNDVVEITEAEDEEVIVIPDGETEESLKEKLVEKVKETKKKPAADSE